MRKCVSEHDRTLTEICPRTGKTYFESYCDWWSRPHLRGTLQAFCTVRDVVLADKRMKIDMSVLRRLYGVWAATNKHRVRLNSMFFDPCESWYRLRLEFLRRAHHEAGMTTNIKNARGRTVWNFIQQGPWYARDDELCEFILDTDVRLFARSKNGECNLDAGYDVTFSIFQRLKVYVLLFARGGVAGKINGDKRTMKRILDWLTDP